RPGIAADKDRSAIIPGIERHKGDIRSVLVLFEARARVGNMPAEVPDGGLRRCGWWGSHLGEQDQNIVRRLERPQPTPARLRSAWELPGVECNCRLWIHGVQMQMVEVWYREHIS